MSGVAKSRRMLASAAQANTYDQAAVSSSAFNEGVRTFWEHNPCGISRTVTGDLPVASPAWFEAVENFRYIYEPFIHSIAQFTRYHGQRVLEIGVGAGTDHLQWARAGAECYGVDLTETAIELTSRRLEFYGLPSKLQRADAEDLPFGSDFFDVVYSWGVIHHSEQPERVIGEILRILKPGGRFIGMMYGRHSLKVFTAWMYWALLRGKPWRSFREVLWNHVESPGTKAYTVRELKRLFEDFKDFSAQPLLTPYDTRVWPNCISQFFPQCWGWFIALRATK